MLEPVAESSRLTHTTAMVLRAISAGHAYGYNIMTATGLPSGTVYPVLRRLEADGWIRAEREAEGVAQAEQRPPRKSYRLTPAGGAALDGAGKRYPLLPKLIPFEQLEECERGVAAGRDAPQRRHCSRLPDSAGNGWQTGGRSFGISRGGSECDSASGHSGMHCGCGETNHRTRRFWSRRQVVWGSWRRWR